jgi:hypothetical protein
MCPPRATSTCILKRRSGIDLFQEKVLGQGQQDNESAVEQAKDEKISDFIRGQFKSITGKDIPIEDKDTRLD